MSSNKAKVFAAPWAAGVSIVLIGLLHLCAEASLTAKGLLKIWPAMGPLSGKVLVSYIVGILVYVLLLRKAGKKEEEAGRLQSCIMRAFTIVLVALVVGTLFCFEPFFHLFKDCLN